MPNDLWTRSRLCELVRGKSVCARDEGAATVAVPDWLAVAADSIVEMDSAESLAACHVADRPLLIDGFVASLKAPAALLTTRVRTFLDGEWLHVEISWLNLLEDELGCILCAVETVDGPEIVAVGERQRGGHSSTDWMVMTLDAGGEIVSVEGRSAEMLGYLPSDLVGRRPTEFLNAYSLSDAMKLWVRLRAAPGNVATSRRPWTRRDGSEIWLEVSYLNRKELSPEHPVLAVAWDITERREQEEALVHREAEVRALAEEFRLLADEVPAAVFRCDDSGNVLFHNARWTDLLSASGSVARLHDIVAERDRPVLDAALQALNASPDVEQRSLHLASGDGVTVWGLTLRSVGATAGRSRTFVGSLHDDTAILALHRQARHDSLTGLLNRQALEVALADALASDGTATLVLFVDLDGFKAVNDTHGHHAGDSVLAEVGRRLGYGVRPDDRVGRYGGDEFVIVCRAWEGDDQAIRDRLLLALGGPIDFPGGSWQPTASIGIARPAPGDDPDAVLRRADLSMFAVKRSRSSS